MNSSAECDLDDCPGPSLNEGKGMSVWSLSVGDPKGVIPIAIHLLMSGCCGLIWDELSLVDLAVTSLLTCVLIKSDTSWLV